MARTDWQAIDICRRMGWLVEELTGSIMGERTDVYVLILPAAPDYPLPLFHEFIDANKGPFAEAVKQVIEAAIEEDDRLRERKGDRWDHDDPDYWLDDWIRKEMEDLLQALQCEWIDPPGGPELTARQETEVQHEYRHI